MVRVLGVMLVLAVSRLRRRSARAAQPVRGRRRSLRNWPARLRAMSDGTICYAWVTSSKRLEGLLPEGQRLAIVLNRAYLLDELERRDPTGFTNWTAHGPSMTVDPRRFINSGTDRWGHQQGRR